MAQGFDVVAFDAPPGWTRQARGDGLMFETYLFGTSSGCQILLSPSREPTAALPQELDRVWSELSEGQPLVTVPPDPDPIDLPSGFKMAQRAGQVQAGNRPLTIMLNLLQTESRLLPVVVSITDTQALEVCGPAVGDFLASLRPDDTSAAASSPAAASLPVTDARGANPTDSPAPRSDPQLAARFGNSVVGTWRYAMTAVNVTLNAPSQVRNVIEVQFNRDGTYKIVVNLAALPGGGYSSSESGTYQLEGQRISMRPARAEGREPYDLDWFFGDRPGSPGNWGLILRSNAEWLGSFSGSDTGWRTFKPAE